MREIIESDLIVSEIVNSLSEIKGSWQTISKVNGIYSKEIFGKKLDTWLPIKYLISHLNNGNKINISNVNVLYLKTDKRIHLNYKNESMLFIPPLSTLKINSNSIKEIVTGYNALLLLFGLTTNIEISNFGKNPIVLIVFNF